MNSLPDPRTYALAPDDALGALALNAAREASALQQSAPGRALVAAVAAQVGREDDAGIARALAQAPSADARRALERAVDIAIAPTAQVALQVFAFPILLVAGGQAGKIPGVVPDVARLRELLEVHGALGGNRNFGLGNALVGEGALAAIGPAVLHRLGGAENADALQLAPEDVALESADERAYLRFLVGAALTPRDAPGLAETAANVAAWGMPWTKTLTEQLAQPGLSLLVVPRPPLPISRALAAGRFARGDLNFQLFLSQALRDFRGRVGEPDVRVAAYADATIRVALSSPLERTPPLEYRWPIGAGDDLDAISAAILELLAECRLDRVDVLDDVQPATAAH